MELLTHGSAPEVPLPAALVGAFVAAGRPVMPADRAGRPRTEEVRLALTRMMADVGYYFEYRRAMETAFEMFGVALPLDRDAVPHPEYDDSAIAASGFTGLTDPHALAAIALDPSAYEGISELLHEEIPNGRAVPTAVGPWLEHARSTWPASPYTPSPQLREYLSRVVPPPSAPITHGRVRPSTSFGRWWWVLAVGVGAVGCLGGAIGWRSYQTGERAHQSLDRFDADVAAGKFAAAVSHFRDAQDSTAGSLWPVPGSATTRLDRAARSPLLLGGVLNSDDLPEAEAALRAAVALPQFDRDPSYRYALGLTLRRAGNLAAAAAEFEAVLARLGERPKAEAPGAPPPAADQSGGQPALTAKFIVVDLTGDAAKARLTHAMTLLELGEPRRAAAWLGSVTPTVDDRPFGPNLLLWVASRAQISDAVLQDIVAGRLPAATPGELRDHAYSCLYRRHYTKAAELFGTLFAHPDFAKLRPVPGAAFDVSRYHAAAAAVRAGRFGDRDTPDARTASGWHEQALKWAADDKQAWLDLFAKSPENCLPTYFWFTAVRYDSWLAVTRDRPRVLDLTPDERRSWRGLWDELDARFQGLRPLILPPEPQPVGI